FLTDAKVKAYEAKKAAEKPKEAEKPQQTEAKPQPVVTGNPVTAPLPGRILEVLVKEGDTVVEGQDIVVLEAMKMENSITTDYAGVVKAICVQPGDTVPTDAVLADIA
ncbi:MAG: acetyl-CoA carboxylase biotin carboxyl carrier protein subunit, partial [Alistipes sp.]|nr:acetyl-CoA carboxylase biotin carboxyl carrier protein subunit [Alistipes sp.]